MDYQPSWQDAQSGALSRLQFVRQVYLWLMIGFGVAALGAVASPFVAAALFPVLGRFFIWALFLTQLGLIFFIGGASRWRSPDQARPTNPALYLVFTLVSGVIAGVFSFVVAAQSGFGVVLAALGMTGAAFLTLTIVTFVSKKDFSFLRNFIFIGLAVMFFGGLIAAIFHLPGLSLVASGVAVIACSAKILWDTSAMLRTTDLSNPVGFSLSLFVNLYNIFISLLNILGGARRR